MPEEHWTTDVDYHPDGTGPWFRRKRWNWSVWHWRPDETTDYQFGWARTKEQGHLAAVRARLRMEEHLHIVQGSYSEIYEAARATVAAYHADDQEALSTAVWRLDAAIERGRVMETP